MSLFYHIYTDRNINFQKYSKGNKCSSVRTYIKSININSRLDYLDIMMYVLDYYIYSERLLY